MKSPEQHPIDGARRKRLSPGTDSEQEQPSLEDMFSPGDWVLLAVCPILTGEYLPF